MTALRAYGVAVGGALLLVVGIVVVATQPVSFGWTAYAPLSSLTFSPPWPTPAMVGGGVLAVVGLLLIAGWVGFRLGRRPRRPPQSRS